MKKLCYLLSLAGHALLLLIVLYARFPITIRPGPPPVVVVRIAEPPLPPVPDDILAGAPQGEVSPATADKFAGAHAAAVLARGADVGPSSSRGDLSFPVAGAFRLRNSAPGSFRLAPVGKSPEPWALPLGSGTPRRPLRSLPDTYYPGAAPGGGGGGSGPGGVFLLPFDIREKAVADWADSVMARIERNWTIPVLARVAYSGWVRIGLTIEKSGRRLALAMEETTLPESLARSALNAVEASLPLPSLPENIAGDTFAFTFVFTYNG